MKIKVMVVTPKKALNFRLGKNTRTFTWRNTEEKKKDKFPRAI